LSEKIQAAALKTTFCSQFSRSLWRSVTRPDLVHVQNPFPDVVLMARLAGKPLLVNVINHTYG